MKYLAVILALWMVIPASGVFPGNEVGDHYPDRPQVKTESRTVPVPGISAVWANNGEDKITRDELRASAHPASVINSVWDGSKIRIFGARNEVIAFNLCLEAGSRAAQGVSVIFNRLDGPGGAGIDSSNAAGCSTTSL